MRRLSNRDFDAPTFFHQLAVSEDCLERLIQDIPYLTDEQLVEAFACSRSLGKRAWVIQAAILYEAQQRSVYGDHSLEAIARRFDISLRQAQKYALVWKLYFRESVNVDAILLDEPSWYVVAASESAEPEFWLGHAQDRYLARSRTCEPGAYFELWASPWGHVRCTCPSFTYRRICKHAEALKTKMNVGNGSAKCFPGR